MRPTYAAQVMRPSGQGEARAAQRAVLQAQGEARAAQRIRPRGRHAQPMLGS